MASVTAGNLRVPGTLTVTNITVNNVVQSSGTIVVTGNQNTIGINTTAPTAALHVASSSINMNGNNYGIVGTGIVSHGLITPGPGNPGDFAVSTSCSWGRVGPLLYICGPITMWSNISGSSSFAFSKASLNLSGNCYPQLIYQARSSYGSNVSTSGYNYTGVSENASSIIVSFNGLVQWSQSSSISILIALGFGA